MSTKPIWIIALVRIFNGVVYRVSTSISWPSLVAILQTLFSPLVPMWYGMQTVAKCIM